MSYQIENSAVQTLTGAWRQLQQKYNIGVHGRVFYVLETNEYMEAKAVSLYEHGDSYQRLIRKDTAIPSDDRYRDSIKTEYVRVTNIVIEWDDGDYHRVPFDTTFLVTATQAEVLVLLELAMNYKTVRR